MAKVLFVGSKRLGFECLRKLHELDADSLVGALTFDDSGDTRTFFEEFRSFAATSGCPLFVSKHRRDAERIISEVAPDICFVSGWYWLISREVVEKVPRGFLGIHPSLLPRYRGAAPLVWAVINGEREVGFSLFSFSEGMDDGDIWGQRSVPVGEDDYISDVLGRVESEVLSLLDEIWRPILKGTARPSAQDHSQATYCSVRIPEDGEIDWSRSSLAVYNFIRAQSDPYPGAFTSIAGATTLTIWRARPVNTCFYGTPGQVAQLTPEGVFVICGDNRPLLVQEISAEGEERVPAGEVLKSLRTRLTPRVR